jgi:S1-C subfamily serine protease
LGFEATDVADLAVIRVQGKAPKDQGPRPLAWADPKNIHLGDRAVAIGYARGIEGRPTVTQGIISATNHSFEIFAGLLQTDAAVNHGNSGGPLLNMRGEVMGVNTYSFAPTTTKDASGNITADVPVGMNFARSCATAKPFVEQIVQHGKVNRPDLGAASISVSEGSEQYYNWPLGVWITAVPSGSLADKVGLKPNDFIVAVGSAATRPDKPAPGQETTVAVIGEFNNELGLRAADASLWIRFIRPTPAWQTTFAAGKQIPTWSGGETIVAYLR